jgi:quercetin dioxygenase-like cupin family protein
MGESHFDEHVVALAAAGSINSLSDRIAAEAVVFRETEAGYDYDWHVAPERQFIVMLDGNVEIWVSDGSRRTFGGGDVLLMEQTTARGHRSRHTKMQTRRSVFTVLGEVAPTGVEERST